jgi:hypothetical protein
LPAIAVESVAGGGVASSARVWVLETSAANCLNGPRRRGRNLSVLRDFFGRTRSVSDRIDHHAFERQVRPQRLRHVEGSSFRKEYAGMTGKAASLPLTSIEPTELTTEPDRREMIGTRVHLGRYQCPAPATKPWSPPGQTR